MGIQLEGFALRRCSGRIFSSFTLLQILNQAGRGTLLRSSTYRLVDRGLRLSSFSKDSIIMRLRLRCGDFKMSSSHGGEIVANPTYYPGPDSRMEMVERADEALAALVEEKCPIKFEEKLTRFQRLLAGFSSLDVSSTWSFCRRGYYNTSGRQGQLLEQPSSPNRYRSPSRASRRSTNY